MTDSPLTRRKFVLGAATGLLGATLPFSQPGGCAAPRIKSLSAALWWVFFDVAESGDFWQREIEAQKAVGFDYLWLCSTTHVLKAVQEKKVEDPYPILFREAERLGMRVLIETHTSSRWWDPVNWQKEIAENDRLIPELLARYGNCRAFWGWYVGYETHHAEGDYGVQYQQLLTSIRKRCRQESPGKPVMISPFFLLDREGLLGLRWIPPEEFRQFWSETLKRSEIDILALQDSGEHLGCYSIEERRPFLEAGKKACDQAGAQFWGNVETAELDLPSVAAYKEVRPQVDLGGKGELWRRVPLDKLEKKMALASEFAEDLITWGYSEFWRPSRGEEARHFYEAYQSKLSGMKK